MQAPLPVRRYARKESRRIGKLEKKLKALSKKRNGLEQLLPFDFVVKNKAELSAAIDSFEKNLAARRKKFVSLKEKAGIQETDYSKTKSQYRASERQTTPHQAELKKLLDRHEGNALLRRRLQDFARNVEIRSVSVGLKEKHYEGDFDVGVYFGGKLQGWFALEHNKKLNALTIESVQGMKGVPGAILKSEFPDSWYRLLANRVADAILASGEHRIALVNWDQQKSARHNPASKGLYNLVARELKRRAKKVIKIADGKYFLYYLKT